ncbi:hypothetical protein MK805_02490 [Shimazuella sp. AN120528]|uniref:hypothetical protein n=1 Tax=Shimazuella soli TaxID=1892854 RepID=UPI001F1140D8|nr:hypothetical protein [Shimazuella soli]MCH5583835.1 hypothetical protein [Shimazuella soli]
MSDYKVRVVISENKLPTVNIENKITDFQSVFTEVASRFYSDKFKKRDYTDMIKMEAR